MYEPEPDPQQKERKILEPESWENVTAPQQWGVRVGTGVPTVRVGTGRYGAKLKPSYVWNIHLPRRSLLFFPHKRLLNQIQTLFFKTTNNPSQQI